MRRMEATTAWSVVDGLWCGKMCVTTAVVEMMTTVRHTNIPVDSVIATYWMRIW